MSAFDEIEVPKSETAANDAPAEAETPSSETPAAQTPEAITQPQEAVSEAVAQEGEKVEGQPTEDDTQFNLTGRETPELLKERHGDSWAIKTARRVLPVVEKAGGMQNLKRGAEFINAVNDPNTTGMQLLNLVAGHSEARGQQLRDNIWGQTVIKYPDSTLQQLYAGDADLPPESLTRDFVKQAILNELKYGSGDTTPAEDDLSQLPQSVQDKLKAYDSIMAKWPDMEKKVTGFEEREKQTVEESRKQKENELGNELYESVFSVVKERISKLGLDILPTDTARVKGIKRTLSEALSPSKLEAAFEANAENARLTDLAISRIKDLERDAAFSYRDPLAFGAEMTLEQALKSDEVASLLEALKTEVESQSKPRDRNARPELVQGAPAGFSPDDPYIKGAQEGRKPFDVMLDVVKERGARASQ